MGTLTPEMVSFTDTRQGPKVTIPKKDLSDTTGRFAYRGGQRVYLASHYPKRDEMRTMSWMPGLLDRFADNNPVCIPPGTIWAYPTAYAVIRSILSGEFNPQPIKEKADA